MNKERASTVRELYRAMRYLSAELAGTSMSQDQVLPYAEALQILARLIDDWEPPSGRGADSPTAPAPDPGTE